MSETFTKINYDKPVKVYRNLKHGRSAPRLYSVVQNNKVVAHRNSILLTDCKFVVRETGRQKVLKTKQKNVHAFVVGHIAVRGAMGIDHKADNLPIKISYDPFHNETFMAYNLDKEYPIKGARAVLLNNNGMSGCYLEEIR